MKTLFLAASSTIILLNFGILLYMAFGADLRKFSNLGMHMLFLFSTTVFALLLLMWGLNL